MQKVFDGATEGTSSYVRVNTLISNRMVLDKVETKWSGSSRGTYDGTFDSRGLRSTQVQSGTIPYASTTTYAYNDRGEVTGSSNNMHGYKTWSWGYDSMGNITGYLNSSSGSVTAGCEYNAFGRILTSTGGWTGFPFGFSSQYTDRESGLVYFGKRFYEPWQGRFLNRDPIEEAGGLNLYSLTGNSPTNAWDVLGLCFDWGFDSISWGFGCWDDWFWWNHGSWGGAGGAGDSTATRHPVYPDVVHAKAGIPAPVAILDTVRSMVNAGAYDGEALVPGALIDSSLLRDQNRVACPSSSSWLARYRPLPAQLG